MSPPPRFPPLFSNMPDPAGCSCTRRVRRPLSGGHSAWDAPSLSAGPQVAVTDHPGQRLGPRLLQRGSWPGVRGHAAWR